MSISVVPYLNFNGDCEEAIQLYMEIFGGETFYLSRWSELNTADPERFGKVMHVEFRVGDTHMSAADSINRKETDTSINLMVHLDDPRKATGMCDLLSRGGSVISPLAPHPAPDDGGMGALIEDRFGYSWIITCPKKLLIFRNSKSGKMNMPHFEIKCDPGRTGRKHGGKYGYIQSN
ncbi:MAG: hypothetical protein GX641_04120 [Mollicutes bacterium]|nr:hypothetical protein [Mollicutes bacterium]